MRKKFPSAALILALLFSAVAGSLFVNLGEANPYHYEHESKEVSPPQDAIPPTVSISSPENSSIFISNNVSLIFKVDIVIPTLPELWFYNLDVDEIYYKASWLPNNTYVDLQAIKDSIPLRTRIFSNDSLARYKTNWLLSGYRLNPEFSINLTGIHKGFHRVEVFATMIGSRETSESPSYGGTTIVYYGNYKLVGSSMVSFIIDSPSILLPQNETYNTSDIPLLFQVHESVTQTSYSLDGQENVMVDGNTTLTGLSNGEHNITVFATDEAGNTGVSETVNFTVAAEPEPQPEAEPFPTVFVAAASVAAVVLVGAGSLIYLKKRKR